MAVAADRSSRFGSSDAEVRINKPLTLKSTFPRFLALGDKAFFGAVVTSQLKAAGPATVTIASLDPDILDFATGADDAAFGPREVCQRVRRMTPPLPFGISTHLYHGERLVRRHFERIAAHGFDLVEIFATRTQRARIMRSEESR